MSAQVKKITQREWQAYCANLMRTDGQAPTTRTITGRGSRTTTTDAQFGYLTKPKE